jgi:hypothetical protein
MNKRLKKKKYEIFYAKKDHETEVIQFIEQYWSKDHVFVKHNGLFEWQHLQNEKLNFILARNIEANTIDGILGFITPSQYDDNLKNNDFWGAIWKTKEGTPPGVGMALLNLLNKNIDSSYAAIGISNIAKSIYLFLGYKVGELNHYYFINPEINNFEIAKNVTVSKSKLIKKSNNSFREIKDLAEISLQHDLKPEKSIQYLIGRYDKHPIYKYLFYGVYDYEELLAIFVIRKQIVRDKSCLRIVDIFGSLSKVENLNQQFYKLLTKEKAEYLDCLNFGISSNIFKVIGFQKLDFKGEVIIPNYFEPFVRKNVKIEFAIKSNYDSYIIFKGDSDQDRPSILK